MLLGRELTELEVKPMWLDVALLAARWSFRQLALGFWVLVVIGTVVGWLYRWIMDDSR